MGIVVALGRDNATNFFIELLSCHKWFSAAISTPIFVKYRTLIELGTLMPNQNEPEIAGDKWNAFLVSADKIEATTRLTLPSKLPDVDGFSLSHFRCRLGNKAGAEIRMIETSVIAVARFARAIRLIRDTILGHLVLGQVRMLRNISRIFSGRLVVNSTRTQGGKGSLA